MELVTTHLIGRFGNQMFQYANSRGFAESNGYEFGCPHWIGDQIFQLNDEKISYPFKGTHMEIQGYGQDQNSINHYTRSQVKKWFTFRPEVEEKLNELTRPTVAAHRRVGDYPDLGYVVVSMQSYYNAARKFGLIPEQIKFVTEENPNAIDGLPPFLPDFYTLMQADTILRGNSSFSWWAATLSNAKVYSPRIEGKKGGEIHDCEFVEGNWPKFAELPNITDLHLKE